jgi:hypothetical protein
MWNVRCTVEQLIDTMSAVRLDNAAFLGLCMLLNDVSRVAEEHAWLDQLDSLIQALSRSFDNADRIGVRKCLLANVVCLVEVAVEAAVVEGHVDVEDIAVFEDALVGNTVADDFVGRGAYRLGEVAVVQRRRVGLREISTRAAGYPKELTLRSRQALWTTSSMWSVVTPGFASRAAMSSTSRASLHTLRMPSISLAVRTAILFLPTNFCSEWGMPSFA